jgi:hypothetical protein
MNREKKNGLKFQACLLLVYKDFVPVYLDDMVTDEFV